MACEVKRSCRVIGAFANPTRPCAPPGCLMASAQHATAGCGVPATAVARLTRPQQTQGLTLALNERYAAGG